MSLNYPTIIDCPTIVNHALHLPTGRFRRHSAYRRTANYVGEGVLITIADESIDPGPHRIITAGIPVGVAEYVVVAEDSIKIGTLSLPRTLGSRYDPVLTFPAPTHAKAQLSSRLPELATTLARETREQSLLSHFWNPQAAATDAFSQSLFTRISQGSSQLIAGQIATGIAALRGAGYGLTPSGDDFIVGHLLASKSLHLIEKDSCSGTDRQTHMAQVASLAVADNNLSNQAIKHACIGHVPQGVRRFLHAFFCGTLEEAILCGRTVLQIGSTSGADLLAGFLVTVKGELEA